MQSGYRGAVFQTFLLPVTAALSVFPLIVLIVMLPVAVVSYRRRGRAGGWTALVFYAFLFYLLAAVLQTVIPLPADPAGYCAGQNYASTPQLRPFYFVQVLQERAQGDWAFGSLIHYGSVWSTAFNVALLAPLGFFLRYLVGLRFLAATAIAFGVSLLFELTQLTGLWFVYPCAYRLFSVDDLMLNTAGAVLGWLVAGPLRRVLPAMAPDRERRRYATKVTVSRRLFAMLADAVGFVAVTGLVVGLIVLFGGGAGGRGPIDRAARRRVVRPRAHADRLDARQAGDAAARRANQRPARRTGVTAGAQRGAALAAVAAVARAVGRPLGGVRAPGTAADPGGHAGVAVPGRHLDAARGVLRRRGGPARAPVPHGERRDRRQAPGPAPDGHDEGERPVGR